MDRKRSRTRSAPKQSSCRASPAMLGSKKASPMITLHPSPGDSNGGKQQDWEEEGGGLSMLPLLPATTGNLAEKTAAAIEALYAGTAATAGETRASKKKKRKMEKQKQSAEASSPSAVAVVASSSSGTVLGELRQLSSLFSRVEFQLQMHLAPQHQQKSALFPRDIGNLLLWAVPSMVPVVESPRMFFIKNKSRLRDCVVVFVNGWSYDMMMCTGVGLKRRAGGGGGGLLEGTVPQTAAKATSDVGSNLPSTTTTTAPTNDKGNDNDDEDEEVWDERICNALLEPVRSNRCWARQGSTPGSTNGGVQYAPLYIPNMKNTLEQDLFWRNDAPRQPRDSGPGSPSSTSRGGRHNSGSNAAPVDSDVLDVTRTTTQQEEARGVGSMFRRAKEIGKSLSNASSPVAAGLSVTPFGASPEETATTTTTAAGNAVNDSSIIGGVVAVEGGACGGALWGDAATMDLYALRLPEHRAALDDLGFTLAVPMVAAVDATGEAGAETGTAATVSDPEWCRFPDPAPTNTATTTADDDSPAKVFAFDCEMVLTGTRDSQLARATLVNVRSGQTAFDMLVKPRDPVTNYLTRFSGIDEEMLSGVTTTLADCQAALMACVDSDTYLVGHSLENDLKACKMVPNCRVLDSAWLFPHPSGLPYKNALKFLSMRYLGRRIQQGSHDSATDALVSAELVYLKMERGPSFGVRERVSVLGLMCGGGGKAAEDGTDREKVESEGVDGPAVAASAVGPTTTSDDKEGSAAEAAAAADCSQPPNAKGGNHVLVQLFDDPQVLTTMMPSGRNNSSNGSGAINAIPVRNDEDATRRIVRALGRRRAEAEQQQQQAGAGAEASGSSGTTATDTDRPFSFMWVQLTETRDVDVVLRVPRSAATSATGASGRAVIAANRAAVAAQAAALTAAEEEQLRRVRAVNDRVTRVIAACPDETLVIVLAGDCSVGGEGQGQWACNNQLSQAQGAAFFFVKDSTAPPPPPAPPAENEEKEKEEHSKETSGGAATDSHDTSAPAEAIDLSSPACQPQ